MPEAHTLDRGKICLRLVNNISVREGRNILLAGPWGSGKTTLLEAMKSNANIADDFHVISHSPWRAAQHTADPGLAFLQTLSDEFLRLSEDDWKTRELPGTKKKLIQWGINITKAAAKNVPLIGNALPELVDILAGAVDEATSTGQMAYDDTRKRVKKLLAKLPKKGQRLLLVVDDLDRCRPEDAVRLLDSLYHFFMPTEHETDWPLTSVWAVNMPMLEEFLFREYRDLPSFDSSAYLEKIFHTRINVPPISNPKEEAVLLWQADMKAGHRYFDQAKTIAEALNYATLGNLRLYGKLRQQCLAYWQECPRQTPDPVREAKLLTLVVAFPGFRENIALYPGMWPEFINRLNSGQPYSPQMAENPAFRYLHDQSLLTLLRELQVVTFADSRYASNASQQRRLQEDLRGLLNYGF
ncbi:MAG: P-loop NTPase fold protein [Rhodocyclaceae bacterium]|nr:P-loop NTPase fold protein [Rhodocyclaceae bacterium]